MNGSQSRQRRLAGWKFFFLPDGLVMGFTHAIRLTLFKLARGFKGGGICRGLAHQRIGCNSQNLPSPNPFDGSSSPCEPSNSRQRYPPPGAGGT